MGRPITTIVPIEQETEDRRAFLEWLGDGTLSEAGEVLGRPKSFMSRWIRHLMELADDDIPHWTKATGIGVDIWLRGRMDSRLRFGMFAADYREKGPSE